MKKLTAAAALLLAVLMAAGCAVNTDEDGGTPDIPAVDPSQGGMLPTEPDVGTGLATGNTPDVQFPSETDVLGSVSIPEFKRADMTTEYESATSVDLTSVETPYTITEPGAYVLSGTLLGRIIVDCAYSDPVILVLDGADIRCEGGSAIYVKKADKVVITLAEGSENYVSDSADYTLDTGDENEPNAAIFSQDDLSINGSGALYVEGNYNNGIVSKDRLVIYGGNISVASVDDGIIGKDSLLIGGGANISVECADDALRSTNSSDASKGCVVVLDANITINAQGDGIKAESCILIEGGTLDITCGGGADDVEFTQNSEGRFSFEGVQQNDEEQSSKGLSAEVGIVVRGGTLTINTYDDAVHSNGSLCISGGVFDVMTGDDAVHADDYAVITGGTLVVSKCFEGVEGIGVLISGGVLNIVAADDGINSAGGSDDSENAGGIFAGDNFGSDGTSLVKIEGGTITVRAGGDGVDSNNCVWITSGTICCENVTSGPDVPYDCEGLFLIDGGVVFGSGGSSLMVLPGDSSAQYTLIVAATGSAGDSIRLTDENGATVYEHTATLGFTSVLVSMPDMAQGDTYTLYVNDEVVQSVQLTSKATSSGQFSGSIGGGIGGGFFGGFMGGGRNERP
ncbi:MAG: carbohydrate-binding domain-containing protein [Clostridia bacterium]|nr:carbohydrate-binding domain-containing protein [Clostridia bacterium]